MPYEKITIRQRGQTRTGYLPSGQAERDRPRQHSVFEVMIMTAVVTTGLIVVISMFASLLAK